MFRSVCGNFATGVAVVTSGTTSPVSGLTVNSFTSVSLDPPLILICIQNESSELLALKRTGAFAVNILAADQEDICRAFASRHTRRLVEVDTREGITGVPILSTALAYLECRVEREVYAGDHVIIIGEVLELAVQRDDEPLAFFRNNYHQLLVSS
ncbi:flavin reductase family protein [Frankia sp. QA3]|uniref:flavin reductase family protein n=1 Tax=Frankia sp. QA3 TaxID=710111 RepID=UPI0018DED58C|nr:flavin reductase family protein [Frankia sp. QA3]